VLRERPVATIERLETSTLHWSWLLVTWLSFIVLRNLLEGVLGPSHAIGFTYFASQSALMVLDHFVLFYASVFLSITVILSALTGERAGRVMRAMVPAWIIVLIPPFVDFLVTFGEGYRISYILSLNSVLVEFFDPRTALVRISPGQRIEVLLACLLAASYVGLKTKRWWRAIPAFVAVYLAIGLHGVLPSLFARLAWWMRHDLAGAGVPVALTAAGGYAGSAAAAAYDAAFRSGGIVLEESRKLALLFLTTATALGWVVYGRAAPRSEQTLRFGFRPLRALHYLGMTAFGLAFGWMLFAGEGVRLGSGGDTLGMLGTLFAVLFAFLASVALNDLCDEQSDRRSGEPRPLALGMATRRETAIQSGVFATLALLFAINVSYATFLIIALCLGLSFVYSAPPVRLKRVPLLATLLLGVLSYLAVVAGFSALAGERAFVLFPPTVGWLLVLAFAAAFTAKDLKDVEGDRATGTFTIPVLLGPRAGRIVTAALVLIAYLLAPWLLPYGLLIWPALILGVASAAVVLMSEGRREDGLLLTAYLLFAFLVVLLIVGNPETVAPEGNPRVTARGAVLRARELEAHALWSEASDAYALAVAPLAAPSHRTLTHAGIASYRAGRAAAAATVLERAGEAAPTSSLVREYLVAAEMQLGNTERALLLATETADQGIRPEFFRGHEGALADATGRLDRSIRAYEAALRLGAPEAETRIRLAEQLRKRGDVAAARAHLEYAALTISGSGAVADALGRFHLAEGDPEGAIAHLIRATELDPTHALYWNNLGAGLRATGEYERALAALKKARALDPRLADVYYNAGMTHEKLGRDEAALQQYLLALEVDPGFSPARKRVEVLSGG